jgi:hypothetical protein
LTGKIQSATSMRLKLAKIINRRRSIIRKWLSMQVTVLKIYAAKKGLCFTKR